MLARIAFLLYVAAASGDSATAAEPVPNAPAEDEYQFLVPETGILFEPGYSYQYQEALLAFLISGAGTNRQCQMVKEEGVWDGGGELAVFIERDKQSGRAIVVRRFAKKSIRQAVSAALFEKGRLKEEDLWTLLGINAADVGEDRGTLLEDTAQTLAEVCEMMLGTVRYPLRPKMLLHPTAVHFAHHDVDHGYRAGRTLFQKGRVGKYRELLEKLGDVARASAAARPAAEQKVKEAAIALRADLAVSGVSLPKKGERMKATPRR